MDLINTIKSWVGALTELILMLIALAIAVSLLYGGASNFFGDATKNIIAFVDALGKGGLAGLITLGIILWLFSHRKVS
jgi:hypothetical protein